MKAFFYCIFLLMFSCLSCFAANAKKDLGPVDPDMLAWSASQCFKAIQGRVQMSGDLRKAVEYLEDYAETSKEIQTLSFECVGAINAKDKANHIVKPYLEAAARKGDKTAIDIIHLSDLSQAWIIDTDYDFSKFIRESAEKLQASSQAARELSDLELKIREQPDSERSGTVKQAEIVYGRIDKEKYPLAHCIFADIFDIAGDVQNAIKHWELCANSGYPRPAFNIGEIYEQGNAAGVKKNFKKAMEWYEKGLNNSEAYIDSAFAEYNEKYLKKIKELKEKIALIEDYEKNGE